MENETWLKKNSDTIKFAIMIFFIGGSWAQQQFQNSSQDSDLADHNARITVLEAAKHKSEINDALFRQEFQTVKEQTNEMYEIIVKRNNNNSSSNGW